MNEVILSIGSNENKETNLSLCHTMLNNLFGGISYSSTSISKPYGIHYKNDFLNQLARFHTTLDKEQIVATLKDIEVKMGRKAKDKAMGIVKIDIDLIIWNEEILRPNEMDRCYIKDLLALFQVQ